MNKRILKNDFVQIEYLTDSLRIVGLTPAGKKNLLADLSDFPPIPTPYGEFRFRGGHRLWHAPEAMPRTYVPDAGKITITEFSDGVLLEAPVESGTGIKKKIEIRLARDEPSIRLIHTLVNDGLWTVKLAPWAISQFRLGGTVILPMPVENVDSQGLLHNRQFSFWPYAHINDPRFQMNDRFAFLDAKALLPPFKMGYFNRHGWMAYWMDGTLFRKSFDIQADLPHPDNNCNAEVYCNDQFVELESLAPLVKLIPGGAVTHTEIWDILPGLDTLPAEIRNALTV
ncbi:MAG: hypothetical protein K8S20_04875 [Chloroflexi bacterium]|nr:hypothetical protein [Chloroflexota bacterium]